MKTLFENAVDCRRGAAPMSCVSVEGGLFSVSPAAGAASPEEASFLILPGLADVHVHLREPGFSYKETIETGSRSGARGGYTDLCAMPNLNPVPDREETLTPALQRIREGAVVRVHQYGALTMGELGEELADLRCMAPHVCAFSDDGRGVQDRGMMKAAMELAKELGLVVAAHCEDNSLLHGGYIHDGSYAKAHGHRGICSESEWGPIARDVELAAEVGCKYHVCHVSTKESVEIIRKARKAGVDVTCETGPHYLLMDDSMLQEDGRFKMNPPLRDRTDREAVLEGLLDGTVGIIATDHAPHSAEEKARGLEKSAMGVVGLESAFPLLYTYLVKPGILSMETLMDRMCYAPRERFGLGLNEKDFTVFDVRRPYEINPEEFVTMGRATPFAGWKVYGRCALTVLDGKAVWQSEV